jgi:hypothetical protein
MEEASAGLTLPPDFPKAALQELERQVGLLDEKYRRQNAMQPCDEWRAFASACNGIKARFRAMADADQLYKKTVPAGGATHEDVYQQDSALFTFFTAAVSTLETACFLAFAMGAQLQPTGFPMKTEANLREIVPAKVAAKFTLLYPKEPLTLAVKALVSDADFQILKETRNVLSHRGNPPRHFHVEINIGPGLPHQHKYIGGPKGDPPKWNGILLDSGATALRRQWVANHVSSIVDAALEFSKSNIRP